jgi:hypothetical protein
MTRDQVLNYGHYMTVGHDCTFIALFMGCQEKSEGHRKYFFADIDVQLTSNHHHQSQ